MRQIPGYEDGTGDVLRVLSSLYGLKQVPRIWNKLFSDKVVTLGYTRMPSEPSIYTCQRGSSVAVLAVYVDDIAVFASKGTVGLVKEELMGLFEM